MFWAQVQAVSFWTNFRPRLQQPEQKKKWYFINLMTSLTQLTHVELFATRIVHLRHHVTFLWYHLVAPQDAYWETSTSQETWKLEVRITQHTSMRVRIWWGMTPYGQARVSWLHEGSKARGQSRNECSSIKEEIWPLNPSSLKNRTTSKTGLCY